jgi:hypothetical protein
MATFEIKNNTFPLTFNQLRLLKAKKMRLGGDEQLKITSKGGDIKRSC